MVLLSKREGVGLLGPLLITEQIAVCRILEEALMNAIKHGQASLVTIIIHKATNTLCLTINDNGLGFDQSIDKKHHYGIKNMANRAQYMGARLDFKSKPQEGTTICLEIPLT